MVAARHAHRAQRVICTHLMPTLTPSLPLPAVPLCLCRHGSAAEMPCGSDCIHWRCWWLPLPFHFFFLLPFQLLHRCVTRCVCVCVLMEGERGCVFHTTTPPASCQQLQAGGCLLVLVAEGRRRVCHIHRLCVWLHLLSPPVLCCVACWCQHGTCCSHPAASALLSLQHEHDTGYRLAEADRCLCVVRAASSCCWCCDMHCVVV